MRLLFAGVAALALLVFSTNRAHATSDAAIRAAVEEFLADRHPEGDAKTTRARWERLGPEASRVILSMLKELGPEQRPLRRIRLIEALSHYSDPSGSNDSSEVSLWLENTALDTKHAATRETALETLVARRGIKSLDFLERFQRHPELSTRRLTQELMERVKFRKPRGRELPKGGGPVRVSSNAERD